MHQRPARDGPAHVLRDQDDAVTGLVGIGVADAVGRGERPRCAVRGADVEPALVDRRGQHHPGLPAGVADQAPGPAAVLVDPGAGVEGRGDLDDPAAGLAAQQRHPAPLGGPALGPPDPALGVEGDTVQAQAGRRDGVGGEGGGPGSVLRPPPHRPPGGGAAGARPDRGTPRGRRGYRGPVSAAGPAAGPVGEPLGEIVTGEAVVLGLRAASFASRMLAALLDAVIVGIVFGALLWGTSALLSETDDAARAAITLAESALCLIGIPVAVETATRGRTVGKLVLGVRVVRDDGGPVRFRHCLVRAVLGLFELWGLAGSPAIISALVTRRGKRVGDLLAGTYVVRERTAARHVPLPPMPPELAGWARTADIGRVPLPVATAARQFLARTATLNPVSRAALGVELADAVLPRVSPAPPAGTDPERFLVAVLVERRDREFTRMQQREARTRELERTLGRG